MSSVHTSALGRPGRNVCNFLQFYNFAMWVVVTFQLQNINSGYVEFEGGKEEEDFLRWHWISDVTTSKRMFAFASEPV